MTGDNKPVFLWAKGGVGRVKRVFISHPYEVWIYGDSEGCKKEREYALSRGKKVLNKCGDQNGEA